MPAIKLFRMDGMRPAWDDRLLEPNQASVSQDVFLNAGTLIGWRKPKLLHTLVNGAAKYAFRIPVDSNNTGIGAPSHWLEFTDPDTDVVRNATINDTFQRYYFASAGSPPTYNTLERIAAGNSGSNAPFLLGIPAPGCPPIVTATGGGSSDTSIQEARSYIYTWVSAYGEESAPSKYSLVNAFTDSSWQIDLTTPSQADMNQTATPTRNIVSTRIYRTVTSAAGDATYFFVAEVPIATITYLDDQQDDVIALNNECPSITWTPPPSDLQGMISMPNGMIAGFRKNEIWFCQPFYPHAWPSVYTLTTEYPIVGLGVSGQSLVVATEGYPVILTGINPGALAQTHSSVSQPCISKGSILSGDAGVFYMSPNGLILCQSGGYTVNFTEGWITRDKWSKLTPPLGVRAVNHLSSYFAFGTTAVSPAISATVVLTSTQNYANGETITVGGVVYTLQTSLTNTANHIKLGATEVLTLQNITDAVNLSNASLAGIEFGAGTVANPQVKAKTDGQHQLTFTALTAGAAGNAIAVSETCAHASVSSTTLLGGVDSSVNTTYAQTGFTIDFAAANFSTRWVGFGLLSAPYSINIDNLMTDRWTGIVLMIQNGQVMQYDFTDTPQVYMPYKWVSKIFQQTWQHNLEVMKIFFDVPDGTASQAQVRTVDPTIPKLLPGMYGVVRVYAGDGGDHMPLVTTREVRNSGELLRILSGFKASYWQFEFEGIVNITSVQVATSVKELREI